MQKPVWMIEDFQKDNTFHALAEEVKAQGMEVDFVEYVPFRTGLVLESICRHEGPVVVQSSIQLAKLIQREWLRWSTGLWATWDNYKCSTYYAYWGRYLLNQDYMFLPLAEVKRRADEFTTTSVFIRPDRGDKSFSGSVFEAADFSPTTTRGQNTWEYLETNAPPTDLVVVSSGKLVNREWRVVCTGDEAITASRYRTHGMSDYRAEFPEEVKSYVNAILSESQWRPDPVFVLDVCQSQNSLHLMEIGSFSVAGLYHCDLRKIVEKVSEAACHQYEIASSDGDAPGFPRR